MADRAARGGGVARPLVGAQGALIPTGGTAAGADWFGPSAPMPALAPSDVTGRSWDFPANYNLNTGKRPYEPISFAVLRALADSWDVLRTVIETRKDQMAKQVINVVPKDPKADPKTLAGRIAEAEALLAEPYPGMEWDEWLRRILEDLFVLDAPAAYARRTMGGDLYGMKPLDGATINRVLDPWGDTPETGAAYVQILKGVGAVHFTRDQLVYRPRNPRNGRAFGYGPVEQVYILINIALKRETWQLGFFTEGNLPDALIGVPMEWTPDQIRNFQDWFDARLSGELGRRRGATFVPGDVAKGYVATKETELFGAAEEWLARVVCYAFSISPQAFVKMMNRATAGTAQQVAIEEGLDPIKSWVAKFWNYVFRTYKGWDDVVVSWLEEDDTDPKTNAETQGMLVDKGIRTRNQARKILGEDPDPSPEADMLMVTTAAGPVPLAFSEQLKQAEAKQALIPDPVAPDGGAAGPGSSGSRSGGSGGGEGGGKPPKPGAGGKSPPPGAAAAKAKVTGAPLAAITLDRPAARRAQAAIKRAFKPALAALADDIAGQVVAALSGANKVRKADTPDPEDADPSGSAGDAVDAAAARASADIDALVRGLDFSSLDVVVDATDTALYDLAADSARKALAQVGVRDRADLVNRVNEAAVTYARDRSAELVGKRYNAAGDLIDNPSPKWSIDETTRTDLRALITRGLEDNIGTPAIAESIQEAYAFSEERAGVIALTEVAFANEQGKMTGWREATESAGVVLKKGWQVSNDESEVCEECQTNEDQGLIALDEDFESGDDAAPAHPNCLPGDTLVAAKGVAAATDRLYQGPVAVLTTAGGKHLTCTPNHPVLTRRGWVGAGALNIGDHVVGYRVGQWEAGIDVEGQDRPARIEEVGEAFGRSRGVTAVPVKTAAPDFHGDGGGSEVAIVRAHRLLGDYSQPAVGEESGHGGLAGEQATNPLDGLSAQDLLVQACHPTARSLVRGGGDRRAAAGVKLAHAQAGGGGIATDLDAGAQQPPADDPSVDAKALCDRLFGLSGEVAFDEIVDVQVRDFSGHVFNLQTAAGVYAAGGIVTGNCQCVTYVEIDDSAEGGEEDNVDE